MTSTGMQLHWPRGLDARSFLGRYWQKAPLLMRAALPGLRDPLTRARLARLARRDDVESRMIWRTGSSARPRYRVSPGPQGDATLARFDAGDATLLVQGVNQHVTAVQPLLSAFDFVPLARRDDLMVSDAAPGGGVGPHVDSYDVFLLQTRGRRLWRIAQEFDPALVEDAPLKLLSSFRAQDEYLVEPGDVLYLPPGVAHDGIALDDCSTWSIGYRAPDARELAQGWLAWLEDRFDGDERYADPDLQRQRDAAWLSDQYVERAQRLLGKLAYDRALFEQYLGAWLTEPKPLVRFTAPARPLSRAAFAARLAREGAALAAASTMLHRSPWVFINGEALRLPARAFQHAARLARTRALAATADASPAGGVWTETLYDWYCSGYIELC
jgi:50S ribosomal protein L16 3-hydroxylase